MFAARAALETTVAKTILIIMMMTLVVERWRKDNRFVDVVGVPVGLRQFRSPLMLPESVHPCKSMTTSSLLYASSCTCV